MSEIWHNKKEKPAKKLHCNRLIITKWGSCLDEIDIDNGATIETDWAFLDDLLALETELERTRKALDVAVDALNTIKGKHDPRCAVYHIDEKTAYDALEQITELEQKDVK